MRRVEKVPVEGARWGISCQISYRIFQFNCIWQDLSQPDSLKNAKRPQKRLRKRSMVAWAAHIHIFIPSEKRFKIFIKKSCYLPPSQESPKRLARWCCRNVSRCLRSNAERSWKGHERCDHPIQFGRKSVKVQGHWAPFAHPFYVFLLKKAPPPHLTGSFTKIQLFQCYFRILT